MEKEVVKGKVIKDRKGFAVVVDGRKYYPSKGCDLLMDPYLKAFVTQEVEVLFVRDEILAIRPISQEAYEKIPGFPPLIICYLPPPDLFFRPEVLEKIQSVYIELMLKSGYLDSETVSKLQRWQQMSRSR